MAPSERRPASRSSSVDDGNAADLMVEVGDDDDADDGNAVGDDREARERQVMQMMDDFDEKVPGEDDEPDMGAGGHAGLFGAVDREEELIPIKPKHAGLFGADVGNVKY